MLMRKLTNSEQFALNEINNDVNFFIENNLKTLAKKYSIGSATLIRLIKKMGFNSLKQMQINYVSKIDINSLMKIEKEDGNNFIINNVASFEIFSIIETKKLITEKILNDIVDLISKSKNINIFGIENSNISGLFLKANLEKIGYNSTISQSIHGAITQIQFMDKSDSVIIIYCSSGTTKECIQIAQLAAEKKIKFIWIGSINAIHVNNALSNADIKVFHPTHRSEQLRFPQITSSSGQLFISNLIFNTIINKDKNILSNLKLGNSKVKEWNM